MKAWVRPRSSSVIARRLGRVALEGRPADVEGVGEGGTHWYISQWGGRCGWAPRVCVMSEWAGRESFSWTTLLAALSAFSLPAMPACARILRRVVVCPSRSLVWMRVMMASRRRQWEECGRPAGSDRRAAMMWRDVRESVAMVSVGEAAKCRRAVWMAASSARRTVLFSSWPVASMRSSVLVCG